MKRITIKNAQRETVKEAFLLYLSSAAGKGVKSKTLQTYQSHFHAIEKRLDVDIPISKLTEDDLSQMIAVMRQEGLTDTSINSYTRTLKVFFSWCNERGKTDLNLKLYKASESVKEEAFKLLTSFL